MASQTPSARERTTGSTLGGPSREPTRILVVIPLLVVAMGLVLTWLGQSALRSSNRDLAQSRLEASTKALAWSIDVALEQATPLRERIREIALSWNATDDPAAHAYELSDLLLARRGVSYVSVSFPDSTFAGAFLEGDRREMRFQVSRLEKPGDARVEVYEPTRGNGLRSVRSERSTYDPRERGFYKQAVAARKPIWTDPYPFFKTHVTGITLAEAVYRSGKPELHAVTTVDFDVDALSSAMSQTPQPEGALLVLHTQDGAILAAPGLHERTPNLVYPADRPLAARDLDDPVLNGLFAETGRGGKAVWSYEIGKARYIATRERVGERQGLSWFASLSVPEERFLGEIPRLQLRSLTASGLALATALAVSILFARHLSRARREAARARAQAAVAEGRARELGSYRLIARIGQGGMGEVWRAEHRLLARPAAIKLIIHVADDAHAPVAEERFRREAETLAGLDSRHTVQIYDYGIAEDGTFFLVMEFLRGVDLDRLVATRGAQPVGRVISFLLQALSSLREAHEAGLVHRDIKPANLFLSRAADELDILKVLDFGVVRATDDEDDAVDAAPLSEASSALAARSMALTQKDGYLGTPGYMAPEQIRHLHVDGRTDLYSLGCIAYYLLTAEPVFSGPTAMSTLLAHMTKAPPSLREHAKVWIPDGLEAIVSDCLAKDPRKRPPSARVLTERLQALVIPDEHAWTDDTARAWWAVWKDDHGEAERPAVARVIVARGAPSSPVVE